MGCITSIEDDTKKFNDFNFYNVPDFSLYNKILLAKVVDIYDGDTCTCILNVFNNYYKFKIRLADIDTPEIKNKIVIKKTMAYVARNRLYNLITGDIIDYFESRNSVREKLQKNNYIVKLYCGDFDKYGRLLAFVFNKDFNITNKEIDKKVSFNYTLINEKLAVYYDGGAKEDN